MEAVTVTQLNTRVKEILGSNAGLSNVWVTGEISNLKKYPSGHYYFTLKDQGSQIRAVLFAGSRSRMDFEPQENMKVTAFGRVDIYVPNGSYQFIADTMRRSGIGDLYRAFEELKRKLDAEGLFKESRKRPLPTYPRRIGVVTSEKGAVIHDIITTSAGRFPADIVLAPAMVQGEGSGDSIVRGIELLNKVGVDVIIVGRGGGSIEDLWAFNEEKVARAIAASQVPVVSAVGHETDFTIADFVADRRAPTPTGAAAIILRDRSDVRSDIANLSHRMDRAMDERLGGAMARLALAESSVSPRRMAESISMASMRLDDLFSRAGSAPRETLMRMYRAFDSLSSKVSPERASDRISVLTSAIDSDFNRISLMSSHALGSSQKRLEAVASLPEKAISGAVSAAGKDLDSISKRMSSLDPMNVLGRGYAMVTDADGRVLVSAAGIDGGDTLKVRLRDGTVTAEVKGKEMKE
jgi:exodeoxyribonuclease VII large subunit